MVNEKNPGSDIWDKIAPIYEETRPKRKAELESLVKSVLDIIASEDKGKVEGAGYSVFEPGCGTGYILRAFAAQKKVEQVVGIDTSKGMVAKACEHLSNLADIKDKITICHKDISEFDFNDEQYDITCSHLFLHLVKDWNDVLDKLVNNSRYYIHFFEDNEYYSAVTGHNTGLWEGHPIKILETSLKNNSPILPDDWEPNWFPGVYLPHEVIRCLVEEKKCKFLKKAKVRWDQEYKESRIKDDLKKKVMSAYHYIGDDSIQKIITELEGSSDETLDSFKLRHTMWAFVFECPENEDMT